MAEKMHVATENTSELAALSANNNTESSANLNKQEKKNTSQYYQNKRKQQAVAQSGEELGASSGTGGSGGNGREAHQRRQQAKGQAQEGETNNLSLQQQNRQSPSGQGRGGGQGQNRQHQRKAQGDEQSPQQQRRTFEQSQRGEGRGGQGQPQLTPPQQQQRGGGGQQRRQQQPQQMMQQQHYHQPYLPSYGGGAPQQQQQQQQYGYGYGGGPLGNIRGGNSRQNWQQRQGPGPRDRWEGGGAGAKAKDRLDHAGVPMSGEVSDCLICCQRSDLYGLGDCLHPICMECALRIRVVGECRQCPQCRAETPTLHFVSVPPGQKLLLRLPGQTIEQPENERKYGLRFESQYVLDCFNAYMANRCAECANRGEHVEFGTFAELRSHLAQAHQLSFCHICCDNLNVLIKDRRFYTREQLQQHLQGALPGEEHGFRGHPTCKFCEQRFYDDEQQYRHLRKEHYFCQFCDQDGREQNVFYRNQHQLSQHNRRAHHPCLDPECLQMGICFRTDVELDVHRAKQHHRLGQGGGTGRGGAIPLDIQFAHSRAGGGGLPPRQQHQKFGGATEMDENVAAGEQHRAEQSSSAFAPHTVRIVPSAQSQQQAVRIVRSSFANPIESAAEFPTLPAAPAPSPYGAPPGWTGPPPPRTTTSGASQRPARTPNSLVLGSSEQFPRLGNASPAPSKVLGQQQQQNCAAPSIWGQKSTRELFAPRPEGEGPAKKAEEPKRPKFVASPDCWPEHMAEKLRAREQGLPDPDPIQPPNWLNPPKKEKKRKSKTVPVASAASRLAAGSLDLVPSSSKFIPLAAYDEASEQTSAQQLSNNWWSAGQPPSARAQLKLTPSEDNPEFVRIQLPGDQRRQEEKQRAEQGKQPGQEEAEELPPPPSVGPPPGFPALPAPQERGPAGELSEEVPSASAPGIVHLTLQSIASALFGGGGGAEAREEEEKQGQGLARE